MSNATVVMKTGFLTQCSYLSRSNRWTKQQKINMPQLTRKYNVVVYCGLMANTKTSSRTDSFKKIQISRISRGRQLSPIPGKHLAKPKAIFHYNMQGMCKGYPTPHCYSTENRNSARILKSKPSIGFPINMPFK